MRILLSRSAVVRISLALTGFFPSVVAVSAAASSGISRADLIGYWPLDGDFKDVLNRHPGVFDPEGGGPAVFVPGKGGQALDLRGGEGHVELSLAVGSAPKTISFFALTPSFHPELVWVGNRAPGVPGMYDHRFYLGTFTDRLFWGGGLDHRRGRAWPDMASDRFHHYALVQRTADTEGGTLEIYQNGQLLETVTYRGTTASNSGRFMRIGRGGGQLTHPCQSVMDDVALFNRALSAAEVAAIARAGSVGALLDAPTAAARPALVVTTDGEVDDMNSFIRLLYYANEFDWKGIVITSSEWHYAGDGRGTRFISADPRNAKLYGERTDLRWTGVDWVGELIDLYAEVQPNLSRHAPGYPDPAELSRLIRVGNVTFEGEMAQDTDGSRWIEKLLLEDEPGPLYLQAWGGANTIARALKAIEERYAHAPEWASVYRHVTGRAVLYLVDEQDDTYRRYIEPRWPDLPVMINLTQFGGVGYQWKRDGEPAVHPWLKGSWVGPHLKLNHGPLLDRYYTWGDGQFTPGDREMQNGSMEVTREKGHEKYNFISEGDSLAFFHLLPVGLRSREDPTYGGWGGRLRITPGPAVRWEADRPLADVNPHTGKPDVQWPVSRWLPAIQNDFAARADWGVRPYAEANHPPVVTVTGPLDRDAKPGETVELVGTATDPDGNAVTLTWWVYREAGTVVSAPLVEESGPGRVRVTMPPDAAVGQTLHLILEGTDSGEHPLTRYQRVVLTVRPGGSG